jgi:hypothetical protein
MQVPVIGSKKNSRLFQAGDSAMRVMVQNVGGNLVYLAHDSADLSQVNSTGGVFQLPSGGQAVFVLAPKQSLFAAANGGAGSVSIAASEAIPVGKHYLES